MNIYKQKSGFTLLEVLLSMFIFAGILMGVLVAFQAGMLSAIKSREQLTGSRILDMVFSKFRSINYYMLFSFDSSKPNYGLNGTFQSSSVYPYKAILDQIQIAVKTAGFSHFTTDIVFMRRDTSDVNANGLTSDLIPFTDNDNNLIDDYDSSIKYIDQNGDGDYYDTFTLTPGGRTISEQPDTHLKEITIKLWKKGKVVIQQTELISLEQFSGAESMASGASLKLLFYNPENNSNLYNLNTTARQNAFNLSIEKPYPDTVVAYRADSISPINISGQTDPVATVHFYLNNISTELDSQIANYSGLFNLNSTSITNNLVEGLNTLWAKATKDTSESPFTRRDIILDLNPPSITSKSPVGIVKDRAPRVSAIVQDLGISTTTASGICPDTITLKKGTETLTHIYNSSTGEVLWVNSSGGFVILDTATYTMFLEVGDNAYYKTNSSWTFTVMIDDPDHSAPSISNKSPIGVCDTLLPLIQVRVFDNQSGIIPDSIVLKINNVTVVDSTNIKDHYNSSTGYVSYIPSELLTNGATYNLEITASHWAQTPPDKRTSTETWQFTVIAP